MEQPRKKDDSNDHTREDVRLDFEWLQDIGRKESSEKKSKRPSKK